MILEEIKWTTPKNEDLVESNSNSCLLALSTEDIAKRTLGFHPDTTRLGREVTAGFLTKDQALKALLKKHKSSRTLHQVLKRAKIL